MDTPKPRTVGLVAVAAIGLVIVVQSSRSDDHDGGSYPTTPPLASHREVIDACRHALTDQLKAPASARWPGGEDVTSTGDREWMVTGSVDAQNSYGALLRSGWTCAAMQPGPTITAKAMLTS